MACKGALTYIAIAILFSIPTVSTDDTVSVPADISKVSEWFNANVKPLADRKASLNKTLVAAEEKRKVIKVRKNGGGDFKTITAAIASIPNNNKQRVIIDVGPGTYVEKVVLDKTKDFVTLLGNPDAMPIISYNGNAGKYGTYKCATFAAESEFFVAANIVFKNTAPRPADGMKDAQAVAFRAGGDKQAFYNCKFMGFQDTLLDDDGHHFYYNCFVEGTIDFIFGDGKSIYLKTKLNVLADKGTTYVTASARENKQQDIGFSFLHCSVTGLGHNAFLGRAWKPMPRVVFAYSDFGRVINPEGWSNNNHPERNQNIFFGEYQNKGIGSSLDKRVPWMKKLNAQGAKPFLNLGWIEASKWLLPPPKL